jgi:hypothetical protein
VHAQLERAEEAEALLHELTRRDLADWHVDEEWLASLCLLAETCAILGDTGSASSAAFAQASSSSVAAMSTRS